MAALLTEDEVLLLGFRDEKLKLDLLSKHGRGEGESVEGALRQLQTRCVFTRGDDKSASAGGGGMLGLTCAAGPASQ